MPELFDSTYFRGQGPLMVADRDVAGNPTGLEFVGDLDTVQLTPSIDRFEVIENTSGAGAVGASGVKKTSYGLQIGFRSVKPSHLARALQGALTVKASGNVVDEAQTAYLDKFTPLLNTNVSTVVVTGVGGTPVYVAGTDYNVHANEGLIEFISGGTITDGTPVLIDYAYAAQQHVAVDPQNQDKYLVFSGINTANNDKMLRVEMFKVQLDPGALDNLISDEPQPMTINGVLLRDTLRTAGDQLFSVKAQD